MKIGVITQFFPCLEQPYRGRSAYQTLIRMRERAEVEVFAPHSTYPRFAMPRHRKWTKSGGNPEWLELKATYAHYPAIPLLSRPFNAFSSARALYPLVRDRQFDLLFNYSVYPDGLATVQLARRLGIPAVLKATGTDINGASGVSGVLAKRAMQQADGVLTVSQQLRHKVHAMGIPGEKMKTIENGCDGDIFFYGDTAEARAHLGLDPEKRYVLYIGRLDLKKGLRELVLATAELKRKGKQLTVVLLGDGPAEAALRVTAAQSGVTSDIVFAGIAQPANVAEYLRAVDMMALPSYNEGCPNVVVEALNCGCPVVGSHVGGIPDLLTEDSGIMMPPKDPNALAFALEEALERHWDRPQIARSHHRSWETVAYETLNFLEDVLASRRARPISVAFRG